MTSSFIVTDFFKIFLIPLTNSIDVCTPAFLNFFIFSSQTKSAALHTKFSSGQSV